MKLKNINLGVGKDEDGNLRDASISFSNRNDIGEMISGNFGMTQGEYKKIESGELKLHDIIVEKVKQLLEIDIESDSLLMVTELKKQLEDKEKTIKDLTQSVTKLTSDLQDAIINLTLMMGAGGMPPNPEPGEESEQP